MIIKNLRGPSANIAIRDSPTSWRFLLHLESECKHESAAREPGTSCALLFHLGCFSCLINVKGAKQAGNSAKEGSYQRQSGLT